MKEKGRFSINKRDRKSTRKSLEELRDEGSDPIDGDHVQGGWLQFGGGKIANDDKNKQQE
ncbi:hypothetical protein [Dyadobacter sediminis]|uniref:Uncharacterized protein n=1 Tax=Dyadobacter sediminis TaxID=1493691 RepID=A0A5R9K6M1_9BACT|nr:hypothetical protein [Dyadobacter sediminis]TLU89431.1 hypothetical protein FEM55_22075 [Dyadobacter sediminis]GGC05474.1 hypothetical protein GCM10011325_35470 [Dyadobacter sediminis]